MASNQSQNRHSVIPGFRRASFAALVNVVFAPKEEITKKIDYKTKPLLTIILILHPPKATKKGLKNKSILLFSNTAHMLTCRSLNLLSMFNEKRLLADTQNIGLGRVR
jgi:hypothetical protein